MKKTFAGLLGRAGAGAVAATLMIVGTAVSLPAQAQDLAGPPSGAGIQPIQVPGNPTCRDLLPGVPGLIELRANAPGSQSYADGTLNVAVEVRNTGAGPVFDWNSAGSGVVVQAIFVKGGPNGNLYNYAAGNPPTVLSSDTGLHSPINPQNRKFYGLSHISFCYTPGAPSIKVTKSCQGAQSIDGDVVTQRNLVTVTNDGDFDLSNISLRETVNSLSCALDDGTPLPAGQDVTVLGSLAQGASASFNVICTGAEVNIANSITATGHSDGGPTSDSATSHPGTECPPPPVMVSIDKNCPDDNDVRLRALDGKLVVEVCPTIVVTNTTAGETLTSVKVTDAKIGLIGAEYGPLAPGASVTINDRCYHPAAPEQEGFADGAFTPTGSSFLNTATVDAIGRFGNTASASDSAGKGECDLCVCDGETCE